MYVQNMNIKISIQIFIFLLKFVFFFLLYKKIVVSIIIINIQKLIINPTHSGTTRVETQVEKLDSCQHLQTAQYHAICKQGAMPVLDSWYRAEGWRSTGIIQP